VSLALELMDGSSLGRDYEMFTLILRNIERALKDVVDGKGPGRLFISRKLRACYLYRSFGFI